MDKFRGTDEKWEKRDREAQQVKKDAEEKEAKRRAEELARQYRQSEAEQIPVLIARDRHGEMTDEVLEDLSEVSITKVLKPVLAQDAVLCTDGNQSYRAFADTENIAHVRLIASNESRVINKVYHIKNVNASDSHLKGWMRRFNGVATKYLPNYLGWRRCLDKRGNSIAPVTYLNCALGVTNTKRKQIQIKSHLLGGGRVKPVTLFVFKEGGFIKMMEVKALSQWPQAFFVGRSIRGCWNQIIRRGMNT